MLYHCPDKFRWKHKIITSKIWHLLLSFLLPCTAVWDMEVLEESLMNHWLSYMEWWWHNTATMPFLLRYFLRIERCSQSWTRNASALVLLFKLLTLIIRWYLTSLIFIDFFRQITTCFHIVALGKSSLMEGQRLGVITAAPTVLPPNITNCCVTMLVTNSVIHKPHTATEYTCMQLTREPHVRFPACDCHKK